MWCIPPEQNAAFVACMEDILDVYRQPYDVDFPGICMDEKSYLLDVLNKDMLDWEQKRNLMQKIVDWQFTADDARIKLKRLYPIICND